MRHLHRKFDDFEVYGKIYEIENVRELNELAMPKKPRLNPDFKFLNSPGHIYRRIWSSMDEEGQKSINRFAKNYGFDVKKMIAEAKRGA